MHRTAKGFSFIEVLLVVVLIGILSAIAIPAFLGQRRNAEAIGDAQQNAKSLQMMLEMRKADNGTYGAPAAYTWTPQPDGTLLASDATLAPLFGAQRTSQMSYTLTINPGGLTYDLRVVDPRPGHASALIYHTDQNGAAL